jgi:hypothetical protein
MDKIVDKIGDKIGDKIEYYRQIIQSVLTDNASIPTYSLAFIGRDLK